MYNIQGKLSLRQMLLFLTDAAVLNTFVGLFHYTLILYLNYNYL